MEHVWLDIPINRRSDAGALRDLYIWLLSHEIGHVVDGDGYGDFTGHSIEVTTSQTQQVRVAEERADAFASRQIYSNRQIGSNVTFLLISLLNEEAFKKQGSRSVGVGLTNTRSKIQIKSGGTHPEFLVRAMRLLRSYKKIGQANGLDYELDQLEKLLR